MKDSYDNSTIDVINRNNELSFLEWASGLHDSQIYCPVCGRVLNAANADKVESGEHDSYVFVHDDIPHGNDDIDALEVGIQ